MVPTMMASRPAPEPAAQTSHHLTLLFGKKIFYSRTRRTTFKKFEFCLKIFGENDDALLLFGFSLELFHDAVFGPSLFLV